MNRGNSHSADIDPLAIFVAIDKVKEMIMMLTVSGRGDFCHASRPACPPYEVWRQIFQ